MRSPTSWSNLLRPGDAEDFFTRRTFAPFDPSETGYTTANALWLAELSRLIYRADVEEVDSPLQPTRTEFLASVGLRQRAFFQSAETNTQAMLVEHVDDPAYAVLVFRGTEQTFRDFETDFRFGIDALVGDSFAVHEGFRLALDSVWPAVERALSGLSCPIFYTGHSLGGALATLAASRRKPSALYTFGSPRVGNEVFVATLDGVPIYRIVDDWDVVAVVPPEALGFAHVGELVTLTELSAPLSLSPVPWLRLLFSPAKPLADHAMVNYVDRI